MRTFFAQNDICIGAKVDMRTKIRKRVNFLKYLTIKRRSLAVII